MKVLPICLLIISLSFFQNSSAENDTLSNSVAISDTVTAVSEIPDEYTEHDVRLGERIFHGFLSPGVSSINCASCHNVKAIDTLNWNPSAAELGEKYRDLGFEAFKTAVMQPTGQVMMSIHQDLKLSDEQIFQVRSYLTELSLKGEKPLKPLRTNRILFIILVLIFIGVLTDLAVTRFIRFRIVHIAVLAISLLFITRYIVRSAIDLGRSENYQPGQPIKFSHLVHAGENQTDCLYCHFNAGQSKFAGIPPANVCNNCHVLIKEGSRSGRFEIAKIYHALENNKPIRWVKVYNLPDHVYFDHSQHVVAGKIDCMTCHGDVAAMDQIVQVTDLSMGWCVNCHRETNVQFDNRFYGEYEQLHRDLREGKIKNVTVEQIGGNDCMKCHY